MRLRTAYEDALAAARRWDEGADTDDDSGAADAPEDVVPQAGPRTPSPFHPGQARQNLRGLENRLAGARQRAVDTAVGYWLKAFETRAEDPAARRLPPFPPGADLAFAEHLDTRLASYLDEEATARVPPALWLALERRFDWHDDQHPVWREHPWLIEARDEARELREESTRWARFLAGKGIVLGDGASLLEAGAETDRGAAGDPAILTPVSFGAGPVAFQIAWRLLDRPTGKPTWPSRLRAYSRDVAEAIACLLDEGRALAPGFWAARAAPATLAYWEARSRRHRGLGATGMVCWSLLSLLGPALLVFAFLPQGGPAPPGAMWGWLVTTVLVATLGLEGLARGRWFFIRLAATLAPWRTRLRARTWPYAVASLVMGGLTGLSAPPVVAQPLWTGLATITFGLAWAGLGLPALSIVWLLVICGAGVDIALLDWAERDAALRQAWSWIPLVVVVNRLLLWQVLTRLPGLVLRHLPPRLQTRGGVLVLLIGLLWFFALPLGLRQALDLPADHHGTPPILPVPDQSRSAPGRYPRPLGKTPVLPSLQET